jgi:hypothetical protein
MLEKKQNNKSNINQKKSQRIPGQDLCSKSKINNMEVNYKNAQCQI